MQARRECPNCHQLVEASRAYCPHCHQAVDPALVDELRWRYRTLQELDWRIAAGGGGQTIEALREEMWREYLARLSDSTASGTPAAQAPEGVSSPPAVLVPPAAPSTPERPPFS